MVDEATRTALQIALQAAIRDRERADATIAFLSEKLGLADTPNLHVLGAGDSEGADDTTRDVGPVPVTDGEFYGMSQPKAARAFLERAGRHRPQKTEAIIAALKKGGITFGGKDPAQTFYAILNRNPMFHRPHPNTWGLSEWYPNAVRKPSKAEAKAAATNGADPSTNAADDNDDGREVPSQDAAESDHEDAEMS